MTCACAGPAYLRRLLTFNPDDILRLRVIRLLGEHQCPEDNEQFCPNCFAGMDSSEHWVACGGPT